MKRSALAKWLREIADAVESGDSAEGRVGWMLDYDAMDSDSYDPESVVVDAFVRTGNLEGQGSAIIVEPKKP